MTINKITKNDARYIVMLNDKVMYDSPMFIDANAAHDWMCLRIKRQDIALLNSISNKVRVELIPTGYREAITPWMPVQWTLHDGIALPPMSAMINSAAPLSEFVVKDNGKREALANGMVRSPADDKPDYSLILTMLIMPRFAAHMTKGAKVYGPRNWEQALQSKDPAERAKTKQRFLQSACRHFMQFVRGDKDEDHVSAVVFNMNGYIEMEATDA